jgi:uncharacterized protein (UPF0548 family)
MFFARRPSSSIINRFLSESRDLPLSYAPVGLVREASAHRKVDEQVVAIGRGEDDFERARQAIRSWKQFDLGWVETFPRNAPVDPGIVVGVLIRHLGFWSLNGCRIVYTLDGGESRFGFAYGTLPNHAEAGEELFEVFLDSETDAVMYRIRAISWPRAVLAHLGQPIVRLLQERFRRDSAIAMTRATSRT